MTEIMEMTDAVKHFILHWGEMGTKWGINRSVAQIHALLYLSERPLNAEEIASTLDLARSNVSTALKELMAWGLIRTAHTLGDRRDHFETLSDVWELFRVILRERKKRELEPTLAVLKACVNEAQGEKGSAEFAQTQAKLAAMLEFFELADAWGERAARLSPASLKRLSTLGDAIFKLVL